MKDYDFHLMNYPGDQNPYVNRYYIHIFSYVTLAI